MPDDIGLGFLQARILSKTGRIPEAVETYMKLARRLFNMKDYDGAINVYKMIVSFDNSAKAVCLQRISEINNLLIRRRRHKTVGIASIVTVALILAMTAGYYFYHERAQSAIAELTETRAGIDTEAGWTAIADKYDQITRRYPFTMGSREAKDLRHEAREKASRIRERVADAEANERARLLDLFREATDHFRVANETPTAPIVLGGDRRVSEGTRSRSRSRARRLGRAPRAPGGETESRISSATSPMRRGRSNWRRNCSTPADSRSPSWWFGP